MTTKTPIRTMRQFASTELGHRIRESAHKIHDHVNQHYDKIHPYGYHLDMVAAGVVRYADALNVIPGDFAPLLFGAYYHDSIEDARMTYNNVVDEARRFMPDDKAVMAAEIVYALTNEKGRTRAERADERYYAGIRVTPYAPLVKMADRLANLSYSARKTDDNERNATMMKVYEAELPHFLASVVDPAATDQRLQVPEAMIAALRALVGE